MTYNFTHIVKKFLAMKALTYILLPIVFISVYASASIFFPALLFFPYHKNIGGAPVYSSRPLPSEIDDVVSIANAMVLNSEIFDRSVLSRPIFLTDGGPRWWILSIGSNSGFGLTRPINESIVVNKSSASDDMVWNGAVVAGRRRLSSVIAHEMTHILIRRRFGAFADKTYPMWVREGYCDYVAHSSTLSDEEATRLRTENARLPALAYYDARQRVTVALEANGGSVQALFAHSLQAR